MVLPLTESAGWARNMGEVPIHGPMASSTTEALSTARKKVLEASRRAIGNTEGSSKQEKGKDMVCRYGIVKPTMESGATTRPTERVALSGKMEPLIPENSRRESIMDWEVRVIRRTTQKLSESSILRDSFSFRAF